jgi:hypothetical protein
MMTTSECTHTHGGCREVLIQVLGAAYTAAGAGEAEGDVVMFELELS